MGGASGDERHFFCCGLCLGMVSRADEGVEDHRDIRGPCLTRSPPRQGATEITFEVRKISTGVSIGARVTWSEIKGKGTPAAMDSRCAQLCRRIRGVAGWCLAKIQSFRTQAACKRPSLTARRGSLRMSLVAAKVFHYIDTWASEESKTSDPSRAPGAFCIYTAITNCWRGKPHNQKAIAFEIRKHSSYTWRHADTENRSNTVGESMQVLQETLDYSKENYFGAEIFTASSSKGRHIVSRHGGSGRRSFQVMKAFIDAVMRAPQILSGTGENFSF